MRILTLLLSAAAQIYTFEDTPLPEPKSLQYLYTFYLFAPQDDPRPEKECVPSARSGSSTKKSNCTSAIDFRNLVPTYTGNEYEQQELDTYDSFQLGLLLLDDFGDVIDRQNFCCSSNAEIWKQQGCKKPNTLIPDDARMETHTIRWTDEGLERRTFHPTKTGAYMLIMSNCGDMETTNRDKTLASVSGNIIAQNPHGYLPGDEIAKLPFFQKLSLVYLFVGLTWMGLQLRWWKEVFKIHMCITMVVWLGMIESWLQFADLSTWNATGKRNRAVFFFAVAATVAKTVFSYLLVLVGCMGWGVTKPHIDPAVLKQLGMVAILYVVLGTIRTIVQAYRTSYSLSASFLLLILIPISILNGGFFYWIATSLVDLMAVLEERRQTAKLVLFRQLSKVLVFAMVIGAATMLYQVFIFNRNVAHHWSEHWLFVDGIPHGVFLGVLMAMMWLWRPHALSSQYSYSHQVADKDEEEETHCIGAAEESGDFWERTHGGPELVAKKE